MIETIGLILLLIAGTFVFIGDHFSIVEIEKENRRFWLKALAVISVILGIFFWIVLRFWVRV